MLIKKISCKSLLNKTNLPFDYCLNPYTGCSHGCVYCYARFMLKYTGHKEEWGSFVDVKANAIEILKKEIIKSNPGTIFLSSVTDPYQKIEKNYELTRNILKTLPKTFKPCILTKSSLFTRDLDLLKQFGEAEVGVTITSMNDWKNFEPGASPTIERVKALREAHEAGLETYVFLGPVLPYITDKHFDKLMSEINFVDKVMVDRLNIKSGNWPRIKKVLQEKYPSLFKNFNEAVFENDAYYNNFKKKIKDLRREVIFCF